MKHTKILYVLMTIIFLAFGCASTKIHRVYEGEDLDTGQLVTLKLPKYIDVISLDKKRMSMVSTFLRPGDLVLELAPGRHTVVVRYNDIWDVTDEYHGRVQSEPATLHFTAEPGRAYLVAMENPEDMMSAQLYASDFRPWIEDAASGERLELLPEGPANH